MSERTLDQALAHAEKWRGYANGFKGWLTLEETFEIDEPLAEDFIMLADELIRLREIENEKTKNIRR